MEIEKAKEVVDKAIEILISLTDLVRSDFRLECFYQEDNGDYVVGLSINDTSIFYNRARAYYEVHLYVEDLTLKRIERVENE